MTVPPVREDVASSPPIDVSDHVGETPPAASSPATCGCDPDRNIFCDAARGLTVLVRWCEKVAHQYGDTLPYNLAVGDLADHLRVDRASVLIAIKQPSGKSDVRSQRRIS